MYTKPNFSVIGSVQFFGLMLLGQTFFGPWTLYCLLSMKTVPRWSDSICGKKLYQLKFVLKASTVGHS